MLTVCRYEEVVDGDFSRALEAYPRHHAYLLEFVKSGDLLMIGTFADAPTDGSMAIFRSTEAAERFLEGDPFITEGVITKWRVLEWNASVYASLSVGDIV